jgi:hypothetical protein
MGPIVAVTCKDYEENSLAAKKKWTGKNVKTSGTLDMDFLQEPSAFRDYYSAIISEALGYMVKITIKNTPNNKKALSQLKNQQKITVEGKVSGASCHSGISTVEIGNAKVIANNKIIVDDTHEEISKKTTVVSQVCTEWKKNQVAANEKFKNKPLTITGTLDSITLPDKDNANYRLFIGEDKKEDKDKVALVSFKPTKANTEAIKKIEKGQQITVVGNFVTGEYCGMVFYDRIELNNGKIK